ncbi:hypothetical protein UUU_43450 [Klebsiella pneumoniae subsp. pneumoniae DSM 30104 = JCM 1662 = NBRC 14940]|jgi:hypothetical protein|nr:hypothetical protein UUU_43450 [Klebsiella pneumoniae subsp. pneumoniae DSM 30104 = JCM 1662 = NBRC 14940]
MTANPSAFCLAMCGILFNTSRHSALSKQLNERVYIMKSIKTFVAVIAMAASFASFAAETVTATASTMDGAEAKIAAQAQAAGASSYKITEAFTGNRVHMTAELNK